MGNASQHFFKFIEAVHNCPAVWDVSSLAYKDTNKNKQIKTEERADKLCFVQTFLFVHRFLFLLFFSSVSLLYVSATTLKKRPCCKLPCLLFDTSLTCEGKSLSTFRSFPTRVCLLSLPCEGRFSHTISSGNVSPTTPEYETKISIHSFLPSSIVFVWKKKLLSDHCVQVSPRI